MATRKRQLQWHKASHQWCKRITDRTTGKQVMHYFGKGTPTRDGKCGRLDEAYDAALAKWKQIKAELDAKDQVKHREQRIEVLSVEQHLHAAFGSNNFVHSNVSQQIYPNVAIDGSSFLQAKQTTPLGIFPLRKIPNYQTEKIPLSSCPSQITVSREVMMMNLRWISVVGVALLTTTIVQARAGSVNLLSQSRIVSADSEIDPTVSGVTQTDSHKIQNTLPGLFKHSTSASVNDAGGTVSTAASQSSIFKYIGDSAFEIDGDLVSSANWNSGGGANEFTAKSYSSCTFTFTLAQNTPVEISGSIDKVGTGQNFVNFTGLQAMGWPWTATEDPPAQFDVSGILAAGEHTITAFADGGSDPVPFASAYRNELNFVITSQAGSTDIAPSPAAFPAGLLLLIGLLLSIGWKRGTV